MEKLYHLALSMVNELNEKDAVSLLKKYGRAEAIFKASKQELLAWARLPEKVIEALGRKTLLLRAEREMEYARRNNISILYWGEPDYPRRMIQCEDAPLVVYYKGKANLNAQRVVSVVGTRNATHYGRAVCKDLLAELKAYDPLVVSGMAYGIDRYAHQGALDNDLPTVGVLGHGLDQMYPRSHMQLAKQMLENGGLLTEYISHTAPLQYHFPRRNRLIAGMADVVIVVEAPLKGGALITVDRAIDYHRDVGAVPGSIYQEFSAGCNRLIRNNKAFPVSSAADLAYMMNWDLPGLGFSFRKSSPVTEEERFLTDFLRGQGPAKLELLLQKSGLEISKLSLILLQMELKELIVKLPGNLYAVPGHTLPIPLDGIQEAVPDDK